MFMMKCGSSVPLFLALLVCAQELNGQINAPGIIRQASFGGGKSDIPYQLAALPDGSLFLGGESTSTNGTRISPAFGGKDFWVVRLDPSGAVIWERSFGGIGDDQLFALVVVRTNHLLLAGGSSSPPSGNKTSPNYGLRDFWLVLLDPDGNIIWERSFGGADDDFATCAAETTDGGFVVAGYSRSPAGGNKVAPNHGEGDFWVVRLDPTGNKLWDQSYGGTGDEEAFGVVSTPGGSLVVAGNSASLPSGNKHGLNYGLYDLWLLRLDPGGDVTWEQVYGGDSDDGYYSVSLQKMPDGGFLVGADSCSGATGNKTSPNFGQDDFWILRLDTSGNRLWETNCGGIDNDYLTCLLATPDGGCVAAGGTSSGISGNKTTPGWGSTDFWLVKLDAQGNREWDKTLGGPDADAFMALSIAQSTNGTLYCCGDSDSGLGGAKTVASYGAADFWLVTLGKPLATPPSLQIILNEGLASVHLFGEPGNTYITESSHDLQAWIPLGTNQLSASTALILDSGTTNDLARFYRARLAE